MKKDILNVLRVLFPIASFKYLWRALCNCWRLLVLLKRDGSRVQFENALDNPNASNSERYRAMREHEADEARNARDRAMGKDGGFMSCFMLMVNLCMAAFCALPCFGLIGSFMVLGQLSQPTANRQAPQVQTTKTENSANQTTNTENSADQTTETQIEEQL